MKKSIRITALLLALLMLTLPLVGCDKIDEMRAKQGFLLDEDTISFNGETYKRLRTNEWPVLFDWRELNITDEDVPVLLSEMAYAGGGRYGIEKNDIFIKWTHPDLPPELYCRSDWYDSLADAVKNGIVYDKFCYHHISLDEEDNTWKDMKYILTDKAKAAIEDIIANGKVQTFKPGGKILPLIYCSSDGFFEKRSNIELLVSRTECYILVGEEGDKTIYNVPDKYKSIFDNMLKAYRGSDSFRY